MINKSQQVAVSDITAAIFGFLALVLVLAVAGQFELPIANDAHTATIILAFLGVAMCVFGGIPLMRRTHGNISIEVMLSMILGVVAVLVLGCRLFGYHLPYIEDDQAAFNALTIIIMIKVVLASLPTEANTSP